jgi:prepilin-type N-terminal cleavage/methylation domain-containing protein
MRNFKNSGFTIVELLIVIVVIGILTAITIVSYNGITNKANTASEQMAAETAMKKAGVYKSIYGNYPVKLSALSALPQTDPAATTLGIITPAALASAPASPYDTVQYRLCGTKTNGTATPTAINELTDGTSIVSGAAITGVIAGYWDFTTGAANYTTSSDGIIIGTNIACFNVTTH